MPDCFVRTLLTIIHAILPPPKRKPKKKEGVYKAKYSALAIADSKERNSNREDNGDNVDHRRGSDKPELYKVYKGMSFAEEVGNEAIDCFRRLLDQEEERVEVEIEMNEDELAFLQGQSRHSMDMSPVRICKNPEGSLSCAAKLQSAFTKERREVCEQQHRIMLDTIPKDLNRLWEDPMLVMGERHLAHELRGVGLSSTYDPPKWKKNAYGHGQSLSFGHRSKMSIQEQRQSLPIYKLKRELIQAMHDNQVLVVIGETGSGKTTQVTQYLAEAGYTKKGKFLDSRYAS